MIHQGRPEIGYLGVTAMDLDHPRNVKPPRADAPYRSRSSRGCPSCGNAQRSTARTASGLRHPPRWRRCARRAGGGRLLIQAQHGGRDLGGGGRVPTTPRARPTASPAAATSLTNRVCGMLSAGPQGRRLGEPRNRTVGVPQPRRRGSGSISRPKW
jgi:hypothetical protein